MRPKEVMAANSSWLWGDVEEIQIPAVLNELTGETTKTRVTNRFPVLDTLRAELTGVTGPLVQMTEPALRSLLRRRSKRLKLNPECTGVETFRHTAATWIKDAGFTDHQVDIVLSHFATESTAARSYTRTAQAIEPKREMLRAVEKRLLAALNMQP